MHVEFLVRFSGLVTSCYQHGFTQRKMMYQFYIELSEEAQEILHARKGFVKISPKKGPEVSQQLGQEQGWVEQQLDVKEMGSNCVINRGRAELEAPASMNETYENNGLTEQDRRCELRQLKAV